MKTNLQNEMLLAGAPQSARDKFNAGFSVGDGCWNWMRGTKERYGKFKWQGMEFQINRAAWVLNFGVIPEGLFALHHCDNTKCVNPAHLWLGTQKQNMEDCARKGRLNSTGNRGDHTGARKIRFPRKTIKLCADDIPIIRQMRREGQKLRVIAERFGVVHGLIGDILSGRVWTHVPDHSQTNSTNTSGDSSK